MKRKLLIALLSITSAACCAVGLAACDKGGDDGGNNPVGGGPVVDGEYPTYVKPEVIEETKLAVALTGDGSYTIMGMGDEDKTDIVIPAMIGDVAVRAIAAEAFNGRTDLTGVQIEDGIQVIGENAFAGCSGLEYISLPNSVTTVGINAFRNCGGLQIAVLSNNLQNISNSMFRGCTQLASITIPDSVKEIGEYAFADCDNLENVDMGSGVLTIGERAFSECKSIVNFTVGSGVTDLGAEVFVNCSKLDTIVISDSVQTIGERLLVGCNDIKNITIPFVGGERYEYKAGLNETEYDEYYHDYLNNKHTYFGYLFGAGDYQHQYDATEYLSNVTVTINNVTDKNPLCNMSFYNVRGVKMVIIKGTVTTILEDTFMAFGPGIYTSFVFPATITTLGDRAFYGVDVDTVYFEGTNEQWRSINMGASEGRTLTTNSGCMYSETQSAGCWHWVDGKPVKW